MLNSSQVLLNVIIHVCKNHIEAFNLRLLAFVLFMFTQQARVHLLDTEPFKDAFGPKRKRKRPKLLASDYESLVKKADGSQGKLIACFAAAYTFTSFEACYSGNTAEEVRLHFLLIIYDKPWNPLPHLFAPLKSCYTT